MNTYPAVRDPGSIELLFRNIRTSEQPDKITTDYLASVGFRRQSDVKLLELLFFLGFIDSNLSPSGLWSKSHGTGEGEFAGMLADAISTAYSDVFEAYPRAGGIDGKALMAFFRDKTGVSDTEAAYMVLTLQVLSDIADFGRAEKARESSPAVPASDENATEAQNATPLPDVSDEPAPRAAPPEEGLSLTINIPAEAMDSEMTELVKALIRKLL
jgi:hypothetical protein